MHVLSPHLHPILSVLSFAFASATVCHCILLGASAPPHARGTMWSITYPGLPCGYPVSRSKSSFAATLRLIRPCASRSIGAAVFGEEELGVVAFVRLLPGALRSCA